MNINDLIFYVLDAFVMIMLIRMLAGCKKIEIKTDMGGRWVIPVVFFALAALSFFNFTGIFRMIHVSCLILMGVLYWFMESGLSPDGIVMIGRTYKYEKLKRIVVDDNRHSVHFAQNGADTEIIFKPEQMRDVRNYLVKNAGIAKHNVRTRERNTSGK